MDENISVGGYGARVVGRMLSLLTMTSFVACAKPPPDPPIAADIKLVSVVAFDRSAFDRATFGNRSNDDVPADIRPWTENPVGWALHFDLSSHHGLRFGRAVYWDRWNMDKENLEFMSYVAEAYDCGDPAMRYEPSRIFLPNYMPSKEGPVKFGPLTPDGDAIYAVYLRPPARSLSQSAALIIDSPPTQTPDVCLRVIGTRRDGRTARSNEVRISAATIDEAVRVRKIIAPLVGPTLRFRNLQAPAQIVVGQGTGQRPDPPRPDAPRPEHSDHPPHE